MSEVVPNGWKCALSQIHSIVEKRRDLHLEKKKANQLQATEHDQYFV